MFWKGKGRPVFVSVSTSWDEFVYQAKRDLGVTQEVTFCNEQGSSVSSLGELWTERDPMVHMNPAGASCELSLNPGETQGRSTLLEQRKQERQVLNRLPQPTSRLWRRKENKGGLPRGRSK